MELPGNSESIFARITLFLFFFQIQTLFFLNFFTKFKKNMTLGWISI